MINTHLQLIRNSSITATTESDAITELTTYASGNDVYDGEPIVVRYSDNDTIKAIIGIVSISGNSKTLSIFKPDAVEPITSQA